MSSPTDRPIRIEVILRTFQPELLEGLDVWLRLGLISEAEVRLLCTKQLTCPLPQPFTVIDLPPVTASSSSLFPQESQDFVLNVNSKSSPPPYNLRVNGGMWQSLRAEISIRWLLFLGVFMIVVSSGVLAATQWEKFPESAQYGVLLAYTLIFWGVSFWAGRQENLRLTAQTLQIVTLLLVPVNFWGMDSFKLWQNPWDWLTIAIATVALTSVTILLLKNQAPASFWQSKPRQWLLIFNFLGLSYIHWGWNFSGFPLIAVYLGMVGTSLITFAQTRDRQQQATRVLTQRTSRADITPSALNWATSGVLYALVILLVRAIFVVRIDITQLGLALGICGWLVARLAQQEQRRAQATPLHSRSRESTTFLREQEESLAENSSLVPTFPWETIGGILILLGWLVAVGTTVPWQATAVSGLGLWFFTSRLTRFWHKADLAALLGVGLQTIWLVWRLVPQPVQEQAIASCTQLVGSLGIPWVLLSLAIFPYVILMVGLTDALYGRAKPELANFGGSLALILGTLLTLIGLVNPTVRSLNLLFSTLTLGITTRRRFPTRVSLVYLTQIMGLLTLGSAIDSLLPNLSQEVWGSILLALMLVEWGFSLGNGALVWRDSAWYIGLGLAGLSYSLLCVNAFSFWISDAASVKNWSILWLITPLALTGVASRTALLRRELARWLSIVAIFMAQFLTLAFPETRLIGLGVAVGLMLVNTHYVRQLATAVITVGFGLSFFGCLLWERLPGVPHLSAPDWFLVGAIAAISLWLIRSWLISRRDTLAAIYASSTDGWGIALCSFELFGLTLHSYGVYQGFAASQMAPLIATFLLVGGIGYRSWQQPANWAFYGLGWSLELLTAQTLGFANHALINLSIANIALGLITQLLGELWRRRHRVETLPSSFHILPLMYGVLGGFLRWGNFTSWTGLSSLGIALIAIGVGRRRQEFKNLLYLGLLGVSVCAYELLFYQLLQAPGEALGDRLIAMSVLGTSIMYAYRVLSPWLIDSLCLNAQELKTVAHLHWIWSSCLLIYASINPIATSQFIGLGTGIFLIRYAIFQGRHHPHPKTAEIWVYLGFGEAASMKSYWLYTTVGQLFAGFLAPSSAPIICVCAYLIYILPWETWGWPKRSWQRVAYIMPLVTILATRELIYPISLLISSGFYVLIAQLKQQIRFTYISVALVDWATIRCFEELHFTAPLWYATLIGLSLLYLAQFDPSLQLPSHRESRHHLRLLGSGAICVVAFLFHQDTGLQPGIISLLAIFAGLAFRVRAFLYVGTAIFLVNAFYQLVVLSFHYPFLKWVIGLLVGITFIWIAANFETRRERLAFLVRDWIDQLHEWD